MQTTLKKADVLVILFILCVALFLFISLLTLPKSTRTDHLLVVSFSDGREELYAMENDTELALANNGHTLTVAIESGSVRVVESSCPDGICRSYAISRSGETLVCAPAGIALVIREKGGEVDAVIG